MESDEYLNRLKLLQQEGVNGGKQFPFKEATGICAIMHLYSYGVT